MQSQTLVSTVPGEEIYGMARAQESTTSGTLNFIDAQAVAAPPDTAPTSKDPAARSVPLSLNTSKLWRSSSPGRIPSTQEWGEVSEFALFLNHSLHVILSSQESKLYISTASPPPSSGSGTPDSMADGTELPFAQDQHEPFSSKSHTPRIHVSEASDRIHEVELVRDTQALLQERRTAPDEHMAAHRNEMAEWVAAQDELEPRSASVGSEEKDSRTKNVRAFP